ncbi:helix-turn-helix domain-containing protein [Actinoplanes teichomyceticus]|uniref:Helix-turn-helix protein n=1 Tax=Actinoplanes teichomyceticus TaxID=1867 RepID=A0A561WLS2_ACTTI|nr:helix-turn-helix transcriptional regulator [Actinoplanes teichomyceticus]TWG24793.1 helix-turn-helix protein [Actinoplanes teichomyceticus]GIF14545.1 transcriptional regulator [Actinoplanes teichomyceticus]
MNAPVASRSTAGALVRQWRHRRRLSQLELANKAGISARHLSFIETGRSVPSRDVLLQLADCLELSLRERNRLLLASGYAPAYLETPLDAPSITAVRAAVRQVVSGHDPYPAVVVDRHWNIVDANVALTTLLGMAAPWLVTPPDANVLRASLHPEGLAPHILNFAEWRSHVLARLHRQVLLSGDSVLAALEEELQGYPCDPGQPEPQPGASARIFVPLRLKSEFGELAFFSTVATFGTPLDITVAELCIESFYPADEATATALRSITAR